MLRKGQISVFIIIGILVIAIFGFMYFITAEIGKIKLETEANRIVDSVLATTPINYYVTLCLEEATKEALKESGDRGGEIYQQDSLIFAGSWNRNELWMRENSSVNISNSWDVAINLDYAGSSYVLGNGESMLLNLSSEGTFKLTETNTGKEVAVHVAPAEYYLFYKPDADNPAPDEYPCNSKMNTRGFYINPADYPYCPFLNNIIKFPGLIDTRMGVADEPNIPISPPMLCRQNDICTDITRDFNVTVQGQNTNLNPRLYKNPAFGESSIQEQIEELIANHTANCSSGILNIPESDLAAFRNFNISVGNITVNTTFGFNGVEITADYPLIIKIQDVEPIIRILNFNYFSPVRYKYIYLLARWIAEEESRELDFNVNTADWARSPWALQSFQVTTSRTNERDMLVTISDQDELHFLRAGPFEFKFVLQNRPPVLEYIPEYEDYQSLKLGFVKKNYDVYVAENTNIELHPVGNDPDNDPVTYSYSGWKETDDAYFDDTLDDNNPGLDCRQTPQECVVEEPGQGNHDWTNSQMFVDTNQSAEYMTNHSDIGYHITRICVNETEYPYRHDCQDVKILVDDAFIVIANITSCFDDIDNNTLISVEDPVCLGADVIDYFEPEATTYEWFLKSPTENSRPSQIYSGTNRTVLLPRDYIVDYSAGKYVPGEIDYFAYPIINKIKTFELSVTRGASVVGGTQGSASVNASAVECIPHRKNSIQMGLYPLVYPPFPFNNITYGNEGSRPEYYTGNEDPFFANHTCCAGDPSDDPGTWQYASTGVQCFNYTEYGLYNANFIDFESQAKALLPSLSVSVSTGYQNVAGTIQPYDPDLFNDIMLRTFTSECGDSSGNSCSNNVNEHYAVLTSCPDLDPAIGQTRRCQSGNLSPQYYSDSNPSCIKWNATTFEQYVNPSESPICAPSKCTTSNQTYNEPGYTWQTHFWLCNATCGNGECNAPYNCVDCRDKGFSPSKEPNYKGTEEDYLIQQTVTVQAAYCLPSGTENQCQYRTPISLPDECSLTDSDKLNEYEIHFDYKNYPEANYTVEVSCSQVFETAADISNGVCTPGNQSSCSDGACHMTDYSSDTLQERCEGTFPNQQYVNVVTKDINSNGIAESCDFDEPVDPDSSRHACEVCGHAWNSAGRGCIGDDVGE